jgi:site-specific DNA recombinase
MRIMGVKKQEARKVYGYIRVSSAGQALDGESLERQQEQIRAYCSLKGHPQPEIIADEGVSGFKSEREGFQTLIKLCKTKQVGIVIVYDLSRLSRSVRGTLEFIEDVVHKNGIEFVSLQNDIDTTTPMGKAFLAISAVFNQLYRDEISYKTKEALKHKSSKGEKTGGTTPFGFSIVDGFKLQPQPDEIDTVRQIYSLRRQGLSLRQIARELEQLGVKTKTGLTSWNPKVLKGILEKQIHQITTSEDLLDEQKDELLEDVVGALIDTERAACL